MPKIQQLQTNFRKPVNGATSTWRREFQKKKNTLIHNIFHILSVMLIIMFSHSLKNNTLYFITG